MLTMTVRFLVRNAVQILIRIYLVSRTRIVIRIYLVSRTRIRIGNADPDPHWVFNIRTQITKKKGVAIL